MSEASWDRLIKNMKQVDERLAQLEQIRRNEERGWRYGGPKDINGKPYPKYWTNEYGEIADTQEQIEEIERKRRLNEVVEGVQPSKEPGVSGETAAG